MIVSLTNQYNHGYNHHEPSLTTITNHHPHHYWLVRTCQDLAPRFEALVAAGPSGCASAARTCVAPMDEGPRRGPTLGCWEAKPCGWKGTWMIIPVCNYHKLVIPLINGWAELTMVNNQLLIEMIIQVTRVVTPGGWLRINGCSGWRLLMNCIW